VISPREFVQAPEAAQTVAVHARASCDVEAADVHSPVYVGKRTDTGRCAGQHSNF